ncbi:MAG: polymorphic toxin-type HINT domain-containing protein, partial [Methylophagaceae bacterium]
YVNIGEWKVESFFEIPTISEINYITNNDDVPSIIEDFEITLDDANIFGDGTTASQSSITGKKCMKVVTTTDGDKWQSGQIYLQHGDLDLTTSNKLVQVEVYSDVATWILMKVIQPRNGTGEESATHASHGGTGWETIDFNFSEPQDNTPIANDLYGRIAFFPLWNGEAFDDSEVTTTYYKTISALRYTVETADNFINFYEDKHYYQLTSNWIRTTAGDGLFTDTGILNLDNTSGKVQTYEVDDVVKSIFINGLPDTDTEAIYSTWSSAGNELPSGSYVTSSIIESVTELTGKTEYGIVGEIKLSEDEVIYTTVAKNFLVYDTGSDAMSFEQQFNINPNEHFLVNASGSLIPIISNNIVVFDNEDGGLLYQLDVETTDAYFVSSSVSPLIVHNCFIAGTMIKLNDGTDVAIEDIAIGDEILTYNETKEENQCGIVGDLKEHKVDSTICITLGEPNTRISDCNVITTTSEHPFFVKDKGWVIASELEAGNFCFSKSHEWVEILDISISGENTVYNLLNVEPTVNGILVHNKVITPLCCFVAGTEIELSNGDSKNIEDIIVGDEVIGWKDGERINGVVSELKPTYLGNRSLYNIND